MPWNVEYLDLPAPFYASIEPYSELQKEHRSYVMKSAERDELLIRMDERQRQMKDEDLPEINGHLKKLNGHLDDHSKRLVTLETRAEEKEKASGSKLKTTGKYAGIISAVIYIMYSLGTMAGWFPPIVGR